MTRHPGGRSSATDIPASPTDAPGAHPARPLAGAVGWLISDGKAGHETQARGVAEALGLAVVIKNVAPAGIWRLAAPFGPVPPSERFGQPGSAFAPPWPAIAIAVGRTTIPYIRALRRHAGCDTFTVVLDDPRTGTGTADLISVPVHDRLRGDNVMTTLTPPHAFSPARIAALRAAPPASIRGLKEPRVAVLLGGNNAVYRFDAASEQRLADALRRLAAIGASFMITPSRRSHASLVTAVEMATADAPRIVYRGEGPNPFPDFLANADVLVVTADSVNMCGEAATTGRPVLVAELAGGSAKFRAFHEQMSARGITRPLDTASIDALSLARWRYEPVYEADRIAREIERRVAARARQGTSR